MCIQMRNTHMQVLCHAIMSEVKKSMEIKEAEQNAQPDMFKCFVCRKELGVATSSVALFTL